MNQSQDAVQTAQAGLLQAQLVEIARLVGRTPESFYAREEHDSGGLLAELLTIWKGLNPEGRDRLLEAARALRDSRWMAASEIGTLSGDWLRASR